MLTKMLLINRTFMVDGSWYAPLRLLKSYKSVVKADLVNTSSSAGDWNGYLIQKLHEKYFIIPFGQENRFLNSGFMLYTGSVSQVQKTMFTDDEIQKIINS